MQSGEQKFIDGRVEAVVVASLTVVVFFLGIFRKCLFYNIKVALKSGADCIIEFMSHPDITGSDSFYDVDFLAG